MSGTEKDTKPVPLALPRDRFRDQRLSPGKTAPAAPVVVMPDYGDQPQATREPSLQPTVSAAQDDGGNPRTPRIKPQRAPSSRNVFEAYGERTSSKPYALRLPEAIDLVIRQMAAEEHTQPLRIIDRILFDHLKRIGRLPPARGA